MLSESGFTHGDLLRGHNQYVGRSLKVNGSFCRDTYTGCTLTVDVTVIDDDEIMQHRRMAALTLLMKHIRQRDMMELLDRLPRVMVEWISPE